MKTIVVEKIYKQIVTVQCDSEEKALRTAMARTVSNKRQVLVFDYDVDDFVPVEDWFHVPFTVKVHWIFQKRLSDFGTGHIKWPVFFTPVRDHALLPRRKHDHDADDLMSAAIPQMRHAFKGRADLLHVSVP